MDGSREAREEGVSNVNAKRDATGAAQLARETFARSAALYPAQRGLDLTLWDHHLLTPRGGA